jgi:hypothetical protein
MIIAFLMYLWDAGLMLLIFSEIYRSSMASYGSNALYSDIW